MASIKKRGSRWFARYRDDTGREHAQRFDRKVDAQRWIDEATTAIVTGQYVDPRAGRETFSVFYADWSRRQVWAPNTRRAMDLSARSVPFADSPVRTVRRSNIEQWVKEMHGRGLAPGTIQTRYNNVKAVLRAAVRDRVIASDPSDGVTLPRRRRGQVAMTLPTDAQLRALLDAAEPKFEAFIALAAFAGLRLGEAAGLQAGDIDFLRRTLTVSRQVQRTDGSGVEIRPPSTAVSARSSCPTACCSCSRGTSSNTGPATIQRGGCSRASRVTPRTRTRSATGGARRRWTRGSGRASQPRSRLHPRPRAPHRRRHRSRDRGSPG